MHKIIDDQQGDMLKDYRGDALPACILMEKGEALDVWTARSGHPLDMVTGLQVRTVTAKSVGHGWAIELNYRGRKLESI